ncbi:hypothetical protein HDU76_003636 [Blyttiomyces sp. JEL0837]|nr:hypothetical protein HDU76_003636 [Blyttiomyces sp. JEL0837]
MSINILLLNTIVLMLISTCDLYSPRIFDQQIQNNIIGVRDQVDPHLVARADPPRWNPSIGMSWQWFIGLQTDVPIVSSTAIYDSDVDNGFIPATVHNVGARAICYVNVGSIEINGNRPDEDAFTTYNQTVSRIIGSVYPGWTDEFFLDIRSPQVRALMSLRFTRMKLSNCDAIEPDNTDSYLFPNGFNLTVNDSKDYLDWLSTTIHNMGMSLALKNNDIILRKFPRIVEEVDFAIVESCFSVGVCNAFSPFITAGKVNLSVNTMLMLHMARSLIIPSQPVFSMEYSSGTCGIITAGNITAACTLVNRLNFEGVISDCNLDQPVASICQTGYNANGIRSIASPTTSVSPSVLQTFTSSSSSASTVSRSVGSTATLSSASTSSTSPRISSSLSNSQSTAVPSSTTTGVSSSVLV